MTVADDWIEQLTRDFQDSITRGAYAGISQLPERQLDSVMACQAHACVDAFVKLYELPEELDLDAFLARMATGGPSRINIQRSGDTILWDEIHEGQCMCPLVRRNIIPLTPALCVCAVHWLRGLLERHAHRPVHVELLDSVAKQGTNCVFRATLGPPIAHADTGRCPG
jgi:hypothetical protein